MSYYAGAEKRLSRSRVRRTPRNATSLPSTTLSTTTTNCGFHRADRVIFGFHGTSTDGSVNLDLKNNNDRSWLAYKVKTTSNRLIKIRPARGFISPEGSIRVELISLDANGLEKLKSELGVEPIVVVAAICVDDDVENAIEAWREAERCRAPMWKKKLPVSITYEPWDGNDGNGDGGENGNCETQEEVQSTELVEEIKE